MKRTTILTTAALLAVVLAAVSCGDSADTGTETDAETTAPTTEAVTADPNDPYAERLNVSANLPADLDFGGAHFRSMVNDSNDGVMTNDITVDTQTGEIVDDTIYERKLYVEELLNVVIDPSEVMEFTKASATIRKTVNAGDDAYDVYLEHMITAGGDTLEGIFLNWYDIPHMNFKQPWYPQATVENITVDGVMYLLLSDVMMSSFHNTYCYYYNKEIAANYDLPDIYDIVRKGDWTFERVTELSKGVYRDLNGDGQKDMKDQYGYATSIDSNVVTYAWAFDIDLIDVSGGKPVVVANNEKMINAVSMLRDFFYNSGDAFTMTIWTDFIDMFTQGQVLFIPRCIGETQTFFREMENYGLLPFPKYDSAQDKYYTMLDGCSPLIAVPKTASNTEMIGAVLEAMGEYSYKYVVPAYYDVALKVKGTRDENSIEMLDIIAEGRVVDFGFVYDSWKGFSFSLMDLVGTNSNGDFASYYKKKEKSVTKHYNNVYETFMAGNES